MKPFREALNFATRCLKKYGPYVNVSGAVRTENDISSQTPAGASKKAKKGLLRSLLCCLGRGRSKSQTASQTSIDGICSPPILTTAPRFLLPPVRHQDMHKKCMVIDLDETLVHSSFKVIITFNNYLYYMRNKNVNK